MKRCWGFLIIIVYFKIQADELLKFLHHTGKDSDKLVIYLRTSRDITRSVERGADGMMDALFIIPSTIIPADMQSMVHAIPGKKKEYALTMAQKADGLHIRLRYNPEKFVYLLETFRAIREQFGIILSIARNTPFQVAKKKGVVLDFGHGGDDPGAVAHGIQEKDITRQIGHNVAQLLRRKNIPVYLTRSADQTVPLDARTAFANSALADLFVSIHANAAGNKNAQGIETFCAHPQLLTCAAGACGSEYAKKTHTNGMQGCVLAQHIHKRVVEKAGIHNPLVKDRTVKYAISQVLAGVQIPAVLIELGFVSNNLEAALLSNAVYQQQLAEGIFDGIMQYLGN